MARLQEAVNKKNKYEQICDNESASTETNSSDTKRKRSHVISEEPMQRKISKTNNEPDKCVPISFDTLAKDIYNYIFNYLPLFPDIMNIASLNKVR